MARIYGIFTVKMEDIIPVNLILMANTVQINNSKCIENVFDLKGSSINREVKIDPRFFKPSNTLKDENLKKVCLEKLVNNFSNNTLL